MAASTKPRLNSPVTSIIYVSSQFPLRTLFLLPEDVRLRELRLYQQNVIYLSIYLKKQWRLAITVEIYRAGQIKIVVRNVCIKTQ